NIVSFFPACKRKIYFHQKSVNQTSEHHYYEIYCKILQREHSSLQNSKGNSHYQKHQESEFKACFYPIFSEKKMFHLFIFICFYRSDGMPATILSRVQKPFVFGHFIIFLYEIFHL